MSKYVRHKKIDANQPQIVKELRALGYSVALDHDDIFVGHNGKNYWFEIKVNEKSVIKESQKKLAANWKGLYAIVWTTEMIIKEMQNV